ncbi:MAG: exonuclease SbcCD subunit D [Tissierellia bacterium]|nr:exonuclease SbcCD subunit D [Tissierellia bacterium]
MKFLHLADLHLGKKVNGYNMIEDQTYAIGQILKLVEEQEVDLVLLAGDVYDHTVPSGEAMALFDDFLTALRSLKKKVIVIAGNHDSPERLAFVNRLIKSSDIYISSPFDGRVEKIVLRDQYGPLNFFLLPYIKPINVRSLKADLKLDDFQKAMDLVIGSIDFDQKERNVILSHQFIVGAQKSDSEELYLGGSEAISIDTYEGFDYVALGHIHKKQAFRMGKIRYPGSLLKYSKSEANYKKSLTLVEMKEKNHIEISEKEIDYLRDMRLIEGTFDQIIENAKDDKRKEDYVHIDLFDLDQVFDAQARLRDIYPNLMSLSYSNRQAYQLEDDLEVNLKEQKDPFELFKDFYEYRKNKKLDEDKKALVKEVINQVWGDL